jgi:hypothetical protein
MVAPESNPYAAVELMDERSCRWNEADVPLPERGVRFSWLRDFVGSICWRHNESVRQARHWLEERLQWEERDRWYPQPPMPSHLQQVDPCRPAEFSQLTVHELVAQHIVPLTEAIRGPLYARVPPSDRAKPEVFLSHAWANSVLSPVPQWHGGTLDALDSEGVAGIKEKFVWIDFVCYNQHAIAAETIAFDMEAIIRSIGSVAFAVTPTPLFDRIWCLWEVLSVSQTGARARFCAGPGYRTDKRVMVNKFFEAFKSVEAAHATKTGDYEKLLAAMISRFGSIEAADAHIRKLMREEMAHKWFELFPENR